MHRSCPKRPCSPYTFRRTGRNSEGRLSPYLLARRRGWGLSEEWLSRSEGGNKGFKTSIISDSILSGTPTTHVVIEVRTTWFVDDPLLWWVCFRSPWIRSYEWWPLFGHFGRRNGRGRNAFGAPLCLLESLENKTKKQLGYENDNHVQNCFVTCVDPRSRGFNDHVFKTFSPLRLTAFTLSNLVLKAFWRSASSTSSVRSEIHMEYSLKRRNVSSYVIPRSFSLVINPWTDLCV